MLFISNKSILTRTFTQIPRTRYFIYLFIFPLKIFGQSTSHSWNLHIIDNSSFGADGTKLFDVDGDGDQDIICGWEQGNISRLYINSYPDREWPIIQVKSPAVEDALLVDLDEDGAIDIVTFSEGKHQRITIHWAPGKDHYFDWEKWLSEDIPVSVHVTQWMFGAVMNVDGKFGPDLVVGGKNDGSILGWLQAPKNPREMESWKLHTIAPAGWIMSIEIADLNHDGLDDILISDRYGEKSGLKWFKNPGSNATQLYGYWEEFTIGLAANHPMFLDCKKDPINNLWEIWVPEVNNGIYHFRQTDGNPLNWQEERIPFPLFAGEVGKSICIGDLNGDGQNELVTTYEKADNRSGVIWSSFDSISNSWQHQDVSGLPGIKYDFAKLIDMDHDGDLDILTSEENNNSDKEPGLGVVWYENPSIKQ